MLDVHQEYRRLRALGFRAVDAMRSARIAAAFEEEQEAGTLRFRVVPDECFDDTHLDMTDNERRQLWARINCDGVWGIVSEYRCACCGAWREAESVWGFVGDDFVDSGYDVDVKVEALQKLRAQQEGSEHASGTHARRA